MLQKKIGIMLYIISFAFVESASQVVTAFHPDIIYGGRMVTVTASRISPRTMIAASESGGLFKTTDGGATWRHLDNFKGMYMSDVSFTPLDGRYVIATCRADQQKDPNYGGIWVSNDVGETWTKPPTADPPASASCTSRPSAYGISFDERLGYAFVATDCGVAMSVDRYTSWSHTNPVRSLSTYGDKRHDRVITTCALTDSIVLAGAPNGLYRTTNKGRTWRVVPTSTNFSDESFKAIAYSPYSIKDIFIFGGYIERFDTTSLTSRRWTFKYSSDTGKTFTSVPLPTAIFGFMRPNFVRMARSVVRPGEVDIYINGIDVIRKTVPANNLTANNDWIWFRGGHADPNNIIFDRTRTNPIAVASDGGIAVPDGAPDRWRMTGGGRGGLNALQIYDVFGQKVYRDILSPTRTQLYIGTQDNSLWATDNFGSSWPYQSGNEGGNFQAPPEYPSETSSRIVYADNGAGNFYVARNLFAGDETGWRNPVNFAGDPYLITGDDFVQNTFDAATGTLTFNFSPDFGATWREIAASDRAFTQGMKVFSLPTGYKIYIPYRRGGYTTKGYENTGLLSITASRSGTATTPTVVMTYSDTASTLGTLGWYGAQFSWPMVYAADPNSSYCNKIMAPDIEAELIKLSMDGGLSWRGDRALTDFITDGGRFSFYDVNNVFIRSISFNPGNSNQILIGTARNGVFYSDDAGVSWSKIPDSEQIYSITDFYWQSNNMAIVASFGRGLWKLSLNLLPATRARVRSSLHPEPIRLDPEIARLLTGGPSIGKTKYFETGKKIMVSPKLAEANKSNLPAPYIIVHPVRLVSLKKNAGYEIIINGYGFSPQAGSIMQVYINDNLYPTKSFVNTDGSVNIRFKADLKPGQSKVKIIQTVPGSKKVGSTDIIIPYSDKD